MILIPVSKNHLKRDENYIFILSKRLENQIVTAKVGDKFEKVLNLLNSQPISFGDNRNRELFSENKQHNLCIHFSSIQGNYKLNIRKLPFELSEHILSYL